MQKVSLSITAFAVIVNNRELCIIRDYCLRFECITFYGNYKTILQFVFVVNCIS